LGRESGVEGRIWEDGGEQNHGRMADEGKQSGASARPSMGKKRRSSDKDDENLLRCRKVTYLSEKEKKGIFWAGLSRLRDGVKTGGGWVVVWVDASQAPDLRLAGGVR